MQDKQNSSDTLDTLPVGQSAHITALRAAGQQRRRLLDLGFVPGARVDALHAAPAGDPVAYGVCGAVIALRRADAHAICVCRDARRAGRA